jgi:hypothetical protein
MSSSFKRAIVYMKCIVWGSCRAYISKKVKEHCQTSNIEFIVIPSGLTPYLQAKNIGIYHEFKAKKNTGGNLKHPANEVKFRLGYLKIRKGLITPTLRTQLR